MGSPVRCGLLREIFKDRTPLEKSYPINRLLMSGPSTLSGTYSLNCSCGKQTLNPFFSWGYKCDDTHSAPEYVNFFKPFHFLAGDQLVVPIGATHISSWLQETQSREWEERTKNKRTIWAWVNSKCKKRSYVTLQSLCAYVD